MLDLVIYISYLAVVSDKTNYQAGCETFLLYFIIYDFYVSILAAINIYFDFVNQNRSELLYAQELFTSYIE